MSKKIVCFGEILMRLKTPEHLRFNQASSLELTYGGGEANVSVSLANYGQHVYFVTKVPDNPFGNAVISTLKYYNVNTDFILKGGERLGVYFLEAGAAQRPSKVVYDRANSALSQVKPGEINWRNIFQDASWFHFTGITPALSDSTSEVTLEAVTVAKELGVTVSTDLNYRKKLWSTEKANKVMSKLAQYVDIAMSNEEDAEKVFGMKAENSNVTSGEITYTSYMDVAEKLVKKFKFKMVAISLRESISASDNNWSILLYDGDKFYQAPRYKMHIVDRVGGGDSFAAGLIYALINNNDLQYAVNFAAAASCLKHSISGDFNLVSKDEVENLMEGDGSGRVQR
jgi:2-dehydro-3-deoxygluconokinase